MPLYRSILSIKEQIGLATGIIAGLSSNDFTNDEKDKLDNLDVNVDSGFANSVYDDSQIIDSGGA